MGDAEGVSSEQFIKYTKILMIMGGIWKKPIGSKRIYNIVYFMYSIWMHVCYALAWLSLAIEVLRLIINKYDPNLITTCVGVFINGTKVIVKLLIFRKNNFVEMYDAIVANEKEIWQRNDPEVANAYRRYIGLNKKIALLLLLFTGFTLLLLASIGVLGNKQVMEYNRINNASVESHYWYQFWFPANKLDHLGWTYSISTVISWTAGIYNVLSHMIVNTSLLFVASQLHILRIDVGQLTEKDDLNKLKEQVKRHLYLMWFARKLNDKVKNVILLEYGLSTFDIASSVATLVNKTSKESIWMLIFLVLLLAQMFSLGIAADEVLYQSSLLADSLYRSKWYLMDKASAQTIYLMMIGAKIPLFVTIGPFGPMNLMSVINVLKAAYSYASIMTESKS